ncbi:MAG: hypothetical protein R2813_06745 [Flavobacteriales bacterium]
MNNLIEALVQPALSLTLLTLFTTIHAQSKLNGDCGDLTERFGGDVPDFSKIDYKAVSSYKDRLYQIRGWSEYLFEDEVNVYFENVLTGDTNLIHSLIEQSQELKKNGMAAGTFSTLLKNSLIFKGTVIGIENESPLCLRFKITYKVRVEDVYWSDFALHKDDVIFLKDINPGKADGCGTETRETGAYATQDKAGFALNTTDIFVADKGRYMRIISQDRINTYFQDVYCSSAFAITPIPQKERIQAAQLAKSIKLDR